MSALAFSLSAPWRPSSRTAIYGGLAVLLLVAVMCALSVGAASISLTRSAEILLGALGMVEETGPPHERAVLLLVRLPRVLLALVVGAALANAGALMQGVFRNPLADPSLVGISAGAALGAALVIVLGLDNLAFWTLPAAAFIGAQLASFVLHRLSQIQGRTVVTTMLLAGIAINAMSLAGTSALTYMATDEQLRSLSFWAMGSLGGGSWSTVAIVVPLLLVAIGLSLRMGAPLNALLLGEAEARHLGIEVEQFKRYALLLTSLMVGVSVAFCGMIGFVGLVVPHWVRLWLGPDYRTLLPTVTLLAPVLLLTADLIARVAVAPAELPIGVVTALVGGPFFLGLLRRGHGQ